MLKRYSLKTRCAYIVTTILTNDFEIVTDFRLNTL
jgi:hypothetical protein